MDHILLSFNKAVPPRWGEPLGDDQCERGKGVRAHVALLDMRAYAGRHISLEGLREVGEGSQPAEEPWGKEEEWLGGLTLHNHAGLVPHG